MDSYTGRATWGGPSTLTAPSSGSAYAHLVSYAPRYYEEAAFAPSPASSSSSMDSSPSPPSSNYPSSPVTPNWNSTTAGSPRIQSHGSPMMGSPVIREDFYREFDLTPASHSLSYSSILCPPPNVPHCLQQIVSDPSSHFSQSRRGPLVPQRSYSSHFGAKSPTRIDFHLAGSPEPGIPMRLLFGESAYDLPIIDPEGKVFSDDIPTTITLRIWWPGYEQWPRRVTMRKATGLLNRIEIAIQVAEAFRNFVEEAVPSRSDGHSDIYDAQWRVGRGGIEFKNLVLLSLYQASKGSFQADIRLEQ